jgi:ferredoxin-type protein NapF
MHNRRSFFTSLLALAQTPESKPEPAQAKAHPFVPLLPGFMLNTEKGCADCTTSACQTACQQGIVVREGSSIPHLNLSQHGCTFCGDCSTACESDCFIETPAKRIAAEIRIDTAKCLAWNNTICRSCADSCNDRAIQFTGLWQPVINTDACTACGFCIGKCPSNTIRIHPLKEQQG